jgi:hypothetical protein
MGQYKVPQNVEAEDKIIGPLTLKQFIYAMIGAGWAGMSFAFFRTAPVVFIIIGVPPALLFLALAFLNKDGQTFEQLMVASFNYFASVRKRLWIKDEVVEAFQVQARKKVKERTQRDPAEVHSQLERLATMVDSRGWNQGTRPAQSDDESPQEVSDRLVEPVPPANDVMIEPDLANDMLDMQNSPLAQNLAGLIDEAASDVRAEAMEQMRAMTSSVARHQAVASGAPVAGDAAGHTGAKQPTPAAGQPQAATSMAGGQPEPAQSISGVTTEPQPNILKLATERDDLTVSQLAATATRMVPLQPGQTVDLRQHGEGSK